ncbi:methylated-DNA--[protein]-cysteine S-methyltransferase [Thiohalobacter thiocyanaticus]|uniref:methylated-DNA--[protein]-cysteine S-methyltransferase n=1 Tax=Thiohalobacter thiocyanaticus TaxID=585455 RepID=A0A426QLY9_9GAMM|nr:methylated-DNA--[protein]-cysteine S-methyltransferase [Thiohalobacter thiocyanaticus]RRQ22686.1 methylated-DNA--[protein]-cysteine S-methyltransferase [Thiohalobacter thiocyanaticus]
MPDHDSLLYAAVCRSPVGCLGIRLDARGRPCAIDSLPDTTAAAPPRPGAAADVLHALEAYFSDPAAALPVLDLAPAGTVFQQRVWRALQAIPCGAVLTYGELAAELGSAPRAVGQACRRNPVPVLVPCHRVVARSGIGGYAGATAGPRLAMKQWLLAHEGRQAERRSG